MRINSVLINHSFKNGCNKPFNNSTNPQYKNIELSNMYYKPLSFGCSPADFDKQLENLSGVHCPCCGTKMITQNEYNELLEKAKNIKTKEELLELLNKNSESVIPKLRSVVRFFNNVSESKPDIKLEDIFLMAKSGANKKIVSCIGKSIEYLQNMDKNDFSQQDKQLMESCIERLSEFKQCYKSLRDKNTFKQILSETIGQMENKSKWDIYDRISKNYAKQYLLRSVLSKYFGNDGVDVGAEYSLVRNLFYHSVAKVKKFDDSIDSIHIFDKLLTCQACLKDKGAIPNLVNGGEKELYNFQNYLDDISIKIANRELDTHHNYPMQIAGMMRKISGGKLYRNEKTEAAHMLQARCFEINQEIDFALVGVDGVPCVGCGQNTITHQRKMQIYQDMAEANTTRKKFKVLLDNSDIIRKRYRKNISNMKSLFKQDNLSEQEILLLLREDAHKRIMNELKSRYKYAEYILTNPNLSYQDVIYIKYFMECLKKDFMNSDPQKLFPFADYSVLISETVGKISLFDKVEYIDHLKFPVKDKFTAQYILFPPPEVVPKYESIFEVIFQDIIRKSVATKDHFVAKGNSGTNSRKNMIVLCKDCNQYKGNSETTNWIMRNPYFEQNAQKHFDFVSEKIKNGEIDKDYVQYLTDLQKQIFDASKSRTYIDFNPNDFVV